MTPSNRRNVNAHARTHTQAVKSRGHCGGVLAVWALCALTQAQANEVYVGVGMPSVVLGYALSLNPETTLRADFATLGTRTSSGAEEGIDYSSRLKADRLSVYLDWFPVQNNFRITGGLTANQIEIDLSAGISGSSITIGDTNYALNTGDRFNVQVTFPNTTPYLGLGWGHRGIDSRWGMHADLGAVFGKAKVNTSLSGGLASQVSQADVDTETQEIRDGVGKLFFIPQLTVGVSYRF